MATEYIHELGDSLSTGASSEGPHVKVIAPEKYKEFGSETYKTISVEINSKYTKPSGGIPKSDLASAVQASLGKADTALQSESDPVFSASAAAGISLSDITDWNSKQPSRLVVTSDDNTAFSKISAALAAGKEVWLNTNGSYASADYSHYVPLTEAVIINSNYIAFIFSRARPYSNEIGVIDNWKCIESSPYWELTSTFPANAATADVATLANNANLVKTLDATNGDVLYIGGGTQQRIENAGHANSAKNYDQVGGIATALNLKQNALVFTNPASSNPGTISNPAVDKAYLDMHLGTSFVHAVNTNWVKYVFNNPTPVDSGTLVDIDDLMVKAGTTRQVTWYSSSYGTCTLTPGYTTVASGRKQYKQYIPYEITIANLTSKPIVVEVAAGGRYGQSVNPNNGFKGHISVDGLTKDTPQGELPSQWTWGWVNALQIGSVPASGSRTWRLWWSDYVDPNNPGTYHTHSVFVTTIK